MWLVELPPYTALRGNGNAISKRRGEVLVAVEELISTYAFTGPPFCSNDCRLTCSLVVVYEEISSA